MKKNPSIILIGRQNVGKSTLFNSLIRNKKSIIDPTPGVTRDIVYSDFVLNEKSFRLIDTGGISSENDEINHLVQKKREEAEREASLILFVVEAKNFSQDEITFAKKIRKLNKKVILVVNKCDTPERDYYINEYFRLGFNDIIPVSAAHNRNINLLKDVISNFFIDVETIKEEDAEKKPDIIKIAILGKPNVGKSSLLNCITEKDRSIVTNIPGTTRDVVDEEFIFENRAFFISDTAGIRRKTKVNEDVEYYSVNRAIKTIDSVDIVFLVLDSNEDVSTQDKKIADQIVKHGKGLIVVLNKWDLQEQSPETVKKKKEFFNFRFPQIEYAPIIPVSALTGDGIRKLLKTSISIYKELSKSIETPVLNKFLQEITEKHKTSGKLGVLKIYYSTQVSTKPVKFMIFINKKSLLTKSYTQYIINQIRERFEFKGIPIDIKFKDKK